jgi:hypothetical protein
MNDTYHVVPIHDPVMYMHCDYHGANEWTLLTLDHNPDRSSLTVHVPVGHLSHGNQFFHFTHSCDHCRGSLFKHM